MEENGELRDQGERWVSESALKRERRAKKTQRATHKLLVFPRAEIHPFCSI